MAQNELLTFKEAMGYLRVSRSTLARLMQRGEIQGQKIGHSWRFDREQLRQAAQPRPMGMLAVQGESA